MNGTFEEDYPMIDSGSLGMSEDKITFNLDTKIPDLPTTDNNNGRWKYNEDIILGEVRDYLGGTYRSHYTSQESKTQTLDRVVERPRASKSPRWPLRATVAF